MQNTPVPVRFGHANGVDGRFEGGPEPVGGLGPNADLVREAYRTDATDDLLVFGRDAGDEKRVVVINFGPKPRQVELRPSVDTRDLFTGEDLSLSTSADAATVEVETLAVFETPTLFGQGN